MIRKKGAYVVSDDARRLNLGVIHGFLRGSYWAKDIPRSLVKISLSHSLNFGVYKGKLQVGLARVITDRATFAYVADVFIAPEHRGKGLSKWLMQCVLAHPELQGLRRWLLATKDAHGLYAQSGFVPLPKPERWMEINVAKIYVKSKEARRNS
jgi:GNAT superfamily N-acetyltransferase